MATNQGLGVDQSYKITEDLTAKQFHCMKHGATFGSALLSAGAGELVVGILQTQGADGSGDAINALIRTSGESMVKIGGNISIGNPLQSDTDGMAIVGASADEIFGRALEGGVDGDIIRANIDSEGIKA